MTRDRYMSEEALSRACSLCVQTGPKPENKMQCVSLQSVSLSLQETKVSNQGKKSGFCAVEFLFNKANYRRSCVFFS